MKVATIVPQNYLGMTKNDDYFMCLANLIGKPGMEKYTQFFTERAAEGKFVIMDNGLIEGDQRPITELAEKAKAVGAAEIILTDVFCDKNATLEAIDKDITALEGVEHPNYMLVPQGSSVDEWVECAHTLIMKYRDKFTIGVPKVLVKLGGRDGRIAALYNLMEACPVARHYTFHLLGCWTTPLEITMLDKLAHQDHWPNVRGVDSAMPFVYARAGKRIDCDDRPDSNPIDFQRTKVNNLLLRYNVAKWRAAADSKRRIF